MAKINPNDADKYQNRSNGEWFTLANDKDVARVQFLLDAYEDLDTFSCHKIKLNDKDRYVDCLRTYEDPIDMCPFCAAGLPPKAVRFVLMYDHGDDKVKIWERGKEFVEMLKTYCERYSPLSSYVFEIERKGKAGDKQTRYNVFPMDRVPAYDLTDVERPVLLGGLILEKNSEEMEIFLDTGDFPREDEEAAAPVARRGSAPAPRAAAPVSRRAAPPPAAASAAAPVSRAPAPRAAAPAAPAPLAAPPTSRRSVAPAEAAPPATPAPLRGPSRAAGRNEVF